MVHRHGRALGPDAGAELLVRYARRARRPGGLHRRSASDSFLCFLPSSLGNRAEGPHAWKTCGRRPHCYGRGPDAGRVSIAHSKHLSSDRFAARLLRRRLDLRAAERAPGSNRRHGCRYSSCVRKKAGRQYLRAIRHARRRRARPDDHGGRAGRVPAAAAMPSSSTGIFESYWRSPGSSARPCSWA